MRRRSVLHRFLLPTCILIACGAARGLDSIAATDLPASAGQGTGVAGGPKYQAPNECSQCHDKPQPVNETNGSTKYYNLTEFSTWKTEDKHALASAVLKNSRSKTMLKLLQEMNPNASVNDCLGCHAVAVIPAEVAGEKRDELIAQGVSCQVCHGPASGWEDDHWHIDRWRNNKSLSTKGKVDKGFVDLHDPVIRAQKCLSCHLGDPTEGKVVTHEMYAAGHPPISGFEMETFAKAMPYHWKRPVELPPEARNQLGAFHSTKAMTIAALVAVQKYARLVGDDVAHRPASPGTAAPTDEKNAARKQSTLDLASCDCAACHHELTVASWRQSRGYGGHAPGRPAARSWPLALSAIAAAACGEQGKPLADAIREFRDAVAAEPFGKADSIVVAATNLEKAVTAQIASISDQPIDEHKAFDIMRAIASAGARNSCDFETARQLGWFLRTVYGELPGPYHDANIDKILNTMSGKDLLALDIPARSGESTWKDASEPGECTCVVNESVPRALAAAAKHESNPSTFQTLCKQLEDELSKKQPR
jgi:hypothetical protein